MINAAAIKDSCGNVWTVPRPGRHGDVVTMMGLSGANTENVVMGFIDNTGHFYGREEAAEHAVFCGQQFWCYDPVDSRKRFKIEPPELPRCLFSEDLW